MRNRLEKKRKEIMQWSVSWQKAALSSARGEKRRHRRCGNGPMVAEALTSTISWIHSREIPWVAWKCHTVGLHYALARRSSASLHPARAVRSRRRRRAGSLPHGLQMEIDNISSTTFLSQKKICENDPSLSTVIYILMHRFPIQRVQFFLK